ncbi:Uncharacterised protein [Mycobacteroides abscessus]|nr:Uncharacterised protein [Mycobacteroides abscessus]
MRPDTSTTGAASGSASTTYSGAPPSWARCAGEKCCAKRSESIVADVMISLRSGRRGRSRAR